jgi:hypothetical protein
MRRALPVSDKPGPLAVETDHARTAVPDRAGLLGEAHGGGRHDWLAAERRAEGRRVAERADARPTGDAPPAGEVEARAAG